MVILVILIGKSLLSKRKVDDLNNYETAWRIEHDVCNRELPLWKTIISRCLHCLFDRDDPDLEKEQFAQRVAAEILQPLVEALQKLGGPIRSRS